MQMTVNSPVRASSLSFTSHVDSIQPVSVFRKVTSVRLETFSWDWFIKELKTVCPILFQILETVVTYSDHRNSRRKGAAHHPGMCLAAAILFKE